MQAFISSKNLTLIFTLLVSLCAWSQNGTIKGRVFNDINNEPLAFAAVVIDSSSKGTMTDEDGNFRFDNLKPGTYNLTCSYFGFKTKSISEIRVTSTRPAQVEFGLIEETKQLDVVTVKASPFNKTEESPVSLRTISSSEIFRNPGGNRDISKVIQILPGVASSASFRNDIVVRGGAPNENRFYLDGIEVPNINHFATQGSSGGPVGMINVNFINEVDFYAGAFPSNRGNALSSVMDFGLIQGNDEKLRGSFMVGSSDFGLTLDGPTSKNSNLIFSVRRSYLQLLFQVLGLPFLPIYNDFQFKESIKINKKNQLTILGLGAIDDFELNRSVNDQITDAETIRRNNYILGNLPVNTQWNYAVGANWKHFRDKSYQNLVISRNHLSNKSIKYKDNIELAENLLLDYNSQEIENKLRLEHTLRNNGWKINAGLGYENATYTNSTYNQIEINGIVNTIDFESKLNLNKAALFSQVSKEILDTRAVLSFGLRTDINDYSLKMANPINQLSPRFSIAYYLTEKLSVNFNTGRYYQLPSYTVLGYRDADDNLVNKENDLSYIHSDQIIGGLEFNPSNLSKITFEGFYKFYGNYPFLLRDSISLANLGGDFGVIGNEPVTSTSNGRSYGLELLMQQKLTSSVYGILSATYVISEFEDKNGELIPSAWDNRFILNLTAGKKFKKNWEIGVKFRYLGGSPYTPFDLETSALIPVWDIRQQGVLDWDRLNQSRNASAHGLDVRVDKKWYLKNIAVNVYFDVENAYNFQAEGQPFIDIRRDENNNPIISETNPGSYEIDQIPNANGVLLPSIGLMIEF